MKRSTLLLCLALTHASVAAAADKPRTPPRGGGGESTARSTPDSEDPVRRAQGHFERGVELYGERNYDGALAEFSRAYELSPNYRVLYNLAQTQAERHNYVEAVRLFDEYLAEGGAEIPAARREATERERESLLGRVATVELELNVGGAQLWVDGRARGVVPRRHTLRLNAGMADIRLEKAGYEPASRQLTIVGGDSVAVQLRLARVVAPATVARPPAIDGGGRGAEARPNTALWLSVGATALLAGATATFGVLATRENDEFDRELRQYQEDRSRLDDTRSRVLTFAALTDAFGVATVVGLGATLFFAFSGAEEDASPAERADGTDGVRVLIGSSGVSLRTDF